MVEAHLSETKESISVKSIVFINSDAKDIKVKISQLFCISNYGKPMLQFFIHSNKKTIRDVKKNGTANKYKAFQLEFTTDSKASIPRVIFISDIQIVQTFLWDIDPKTSRGTVTTVQSATT